MSEVKVSVIVPIYNVEAYLEKCLQNLAEQTLKEIEVIMVNDGSTDRSGEIALRYSQQYDNFTLLEQSNKGLSASRNAGIAIAKGEYVQFCDSDDFIRRDTLELLYNMAQKEQLEILHYEYKAFYDETEMDSDVDEKVDVAASRMKGYYNEIMSGKKCLDIMLKTDVKSSSCIMLIRSELLVKSGVRFYEGIVHEDILFQFQLYLKTTRIKNIPDYLYYRRLRKGSIMNSDISMERFRGFSKCCIEMCRSYLPDEIGDYSNIGNYVVFSFSQAMDQWEKMCKAGEVKKEDKELLKQLSNSVRKYRGRKTKKMKFVGWMPWIYQIYCVRIRRGT